MAVKLVLTSFLFCCLWRSRLAQAFEFFEPFVENLSLSSAVAATAADFNGDGRLDITAVDGTSQVMTYLQDPRDRSVWTAMPARTLGTSCYFTISGDYDGDGHDDVFVADPGTGLYLLHGRGDGTFEKDNGLPKVSSPRWVTTGDLNGDGFLDFATANHNANAVGILLGQGQGAFKLNPEIPTGGEPHSIESLDFDGDGNLDLVVGTDTQGMVPLKGQGDGKFTAQKPITKTAGCYRYLVTGDIDEDGRGDVIAEWCGACISQGDGTFQDAGIPHIVPRALADIDNDGTLDLVGIQTSEAPFWLVVLYGMQGSQFHAPMRLTPSLADYFGGTILARDFDLDGQVDLVVLSDNEPKASVIWGTSTGKFSTTGFSLVLPGTKTLSVGDLNQDRTPDLFVGAGASTKVNVYLGNGGAFPADPSAILKPQTLFSTLEVVDVDGDSVPDLAGTNLSRGSLLLALLNADGSIRSETEIAAGSQPSLVRSGTLDAGQGLDLVVPCRGSNHLAIFSKPGNGNPPPARILPSILRPKDAVLVDFDRDGSTDIVALSTEEMAIHYGAPGGGLSEPQRVVRDESKRYSEPAIADMDGDGLLDLLVHERRQLTQVLIFRARGGRQLELMPPIPANDLLDHFVLGDVDRDGLLDLTFSGGPKGAISLVLNQGANGFSKPQTLTLGIPLLGHKLLDLNVDGTSDLIAYHSLGAFVFMGRPAAPPKPFLRGDASLDGLLELNDSILVIGRLFLGGEPLACEDAADANDDGAVDVSDPVAVLRRLFLGGDSLPPPGPERCGEDPTAGDALPVCAAGC